MQTMQQPPTTRAFVVTPDAAAPSVKKVLLRIVARYGVSNVALVVTKLDRQRRTRVALRHPTHPRSSSTIDSLARDQPAWAITEVHVEESERDVFSGRRVVPTPVEISGGQGSSGCEDASMSASVDTSSTTSARMVAQLAAAEARAQAALQREQRFMEVIELMSSMGITRGEAETRV